LRSFHRGLRDRPPMSDAEGIKRQILRSTSIIGGATIAGLLIGLLKMKAIALLLGTTGVGLLGGLGSLLTMGASIAGMGIDSSAVRQIAAARDDPVRAAIVRRAVWSCAWALALAGAFLFWLFRDKLAQLGLGSSAYSTQVGLLAPGIAASILAAAKVAQVQAYRRMGDLARLRIGSALIAAIAGVGLVYELGMGGVVAAVLAMPLATCLSALLMTRAPGLPKVSPSIPELAAEWRTLVGVGVAVTLTTIVGSATQAAVRGILASDLGLDSAGLFQASYSISSLNLGLVLGAMVPEYYPRLSEASNSPGTVRELLDHQVHVAFLIAAPALLAISAAAPILLHILYSEDFARAALLLRLQIVADALRLPGWALGFVLLARRRTTAYVLVEVTLAIVFVPLAWWAAPRWGVASAGAAYLIAYAMSLAVAMLCAFRDGIRLGGSNGVLLICLAAALMLIAILSTFNETASLIAGMAAFVFACCYSIRELDKLGINRAWAAARLARRGRDAGGA